MSASASVPASVQHDQAGFRRVLGLGSLLAVAVGLVVSQGVMVMMLQGSVPPAWASSCPWGWPTCWP